MQMIDPLSPNAEDNEGDYWDPWMALRMPCGGYSSAVDQNMIDVLRGIDNGEYGTDIAGRLGLAPEHVELIQYILCSADWCEYGTSPRGCFFVHDHGDDFGERLIAAWEAYFVRKWGERPAPTDTALADGEG